MILHCLGNTEPNNSHIRGSQLPPRSIDLHPRSYHPAAPSPPRDRCPYYIFSARSRRRCRNQGRRSQHFGYCRLSSSSPPSAPTLGQHTHFRLGSAGSTSPHSKLRPRVSRRGVYVSPQERFWVLSSAVFLCCRDRVCTTGSMAIRSN